MDTIRKELLVEWSDELRLMNTLRDSLLSAGIDASNTIIVTVSTDYSSVIGQYLRHQLTKDGEICDGFGIDVPYPDQTFNGRFMQELCEMFRIHLDSIAEKNILLVEAGVIRGGNYTKVVDIIKNTLEIKLPILTLAMYENIHSIYKSDFVGEYYDDKTQDLTFWWEKENNHWAN
jgi:hypothetical protein